MIFLFSFSDMIHPVKMSEFGLNIDKFMPWNSKSFEDFLYFCCPKCDLKCKSSHEFVLHTVNNHQSSYQHCIDSKESIETLDHIEDIKDEEDWLDFDDDMKTEPFGEINNIPVKDKDIDFKNKIQQTSSIEIDESSIQEMKKEFSYNDT